MATEIRGTIQKLEMQKRDPLVPNYYSNAEEKEVFLSVVLLGEDGLKYYFNTPHARQSICFAVDAAVVLFEVENGAAQWLQEVGDRRVCTREQPNNNKVIPRAQVGDEVVIKGRLTLRVSKIGNPYGKLTHVKRVK